MSVLMYSDCQSNWEKYVNKQKKIDVHDRIPGPLLISPWLKLYR